MQTLQPGVHGRERATANALMRRWVVRPSKAYWTEITVVIAAKAVAMMALYFLFFASPPQMPDLARHVFQAGQAK